MNIKSVKEFYTPLDNTLQYILTTKDNEVWFVPITEGNSDYKEIMKWVAEGNTIEEAD
jgi:hypothetical protein